MIDRRGLLIGAAVITAAPAFVLADSDRKSLAGKRFERPQVETMSAERAHDLAERGELVLVDVRPSSAWPVEGVPDLAEPLDFSDPMFWDVIDVLTEGDKGTPVALICWTGGRSLHVAQEMMKRGYQRPIDVGEGIRGSKDGPGWMAKGLPMKAYE